MKNFLLAGVAAAALYSAPLLAADLPVKAPVAPAAFSWTGLYAGVHAGYGWSDYKIVDNFFIQNAAMKPSGGLGGFQLGYNSSIAPNWILGSEMDFSLADMKANTVTSPGALPTDVKIDFLGTARARLGYTMDRTLIYVTGGMAWAHINGHEVLAGIGEVFSPNTYHMGWTIGGGFEYAFDSHWSAKVEYLYADLGQTIHFIGGAGFVRSTDLTMNTVKAGINYRFGDPESAAPMLPVKARPAAFSWNGSYIGAHAGYAWGDFRAVDNFVLDASKLNPRGAFGGIQTGYNWQFAPSWLFGIETDTSFAGIKDSGVTSLFGFAVNTKVDSFGTLRARLGYVADRTLFYATGGLAWAHIKFAETNPGNTFMRFDTYQVGWTAGAGLEYAIDRKWSAKIEYLYADYGRGTDVFTGNARSWSLTTSTVKAGLNYKFDLADLFQTGGAR